MNGYPQRQTLTLTKHLIHPTCRRKRLLLMEVNMSEHRMRREHAVAAAENAVSLLSREQWAKACDKLQESLNVARQLETDKQREKAWKPHSQ